MKQAVLVLFLLGATCATAQTGYAARYFPFDDGNVWLYQFQRQAGPTFEAPTDTVRGLAEMRVDGDTLIEGRVWKRLRLRQFTLAGVQTAQVTSAAEIDAQYGWVSMRYQIARFSPVTGTPASLYGLSLLVGVTPSDINIGGLVYRVAGTSRSSGLFWYDGLDRGDGECSWTYVAADIGMTSYDCFSRSGAPYISVSSRLVYARVGERVYGVNVVAGETGPAPSAPSGLRAYPVPARQSVTVEADEATTIGVFDALGRRVATGEAAPGRPLRLGVSAWPAGVYIARDAAGRSARLVVAR